MAKMNPYKRAVAVTGSYTDRNGDEKKRYTNIGTLFKYEDGNLTLKLDSVPVGDGWNGFVSFYDIEEKRDGKPGGSSGPAQRQASTGFAADLDDEIPFIEWGDR